MHHQLGITQRIASRRSVLQLGFALGAALGSVRLIGGAEAQGTPEAAGDAYARPEMLIDATELMERVGDPALTIIAVMLPEEYAQGHIPGAVQFGYADFKITDRSDAGYAAWQTNMQELFGSIGVTADTTVVTYDGAGEDIYATRPWWVLEYLGHNDVRVLNGGLAAWTEAGGEISVEPAAEVPDSTAAFEGELRQAELVTREQVLESLDDPDVVILDARSPEEYADVHIPGAVNVNYVLNRATTGPSYWLPQDELLAMYDEAGVTPDKRVIAYCRTGARGSVSYFALRLIGYDNVSLYSAGWEEWGEDPETPKAVGSEPQA